MAKPQDVMQAVSQVMYARLADIPEVSHLDEHVMSDYADSLARAALAVVRKHLPVRAEAWDEGYDYATNGKWGPGENPYREGGAS